MSTTVDVLLVRIEADLADLKRDLARVTAQTEGSANKMAGAFKKVGAAIAAIGGTYAFGGFIKSAIETGASVEGLRVQLNALLGSVDEGSKAFEKMTEFASRVPFSLEEIQAASGSLAAASKNAEQLGELMQVTGNIAAQFNIPFAQAAENVQRSMSAGAASADLFQQKGVNAFMGFQAGVSYSAAETTKTLIENFGTGGKYDGAMGEFAKTTGGALSMFGDAMFSIRKSMAESGLNEGFKDLLSAITDTIKGSTGLASVIGSALGKAMSGLAIIVRNLSGAMDALAVVMVGVFASQLPRIAAGVIAYAGSLNLAAIGTGALTAATAALNVVLSAAGGPIGVFLALLSAGTAAALLFGKSHDTLAEKMGKAEAAQRALTEAKETFDRSNTAENRDEVFKLSLEYVQLSASALEAAKSQLAVAQAHAATMSAIAAQQIDPNDIEGGFLQGEAEAAANRVTYLEGYIKKAQDAITAAQGEAGTNPTVIDVAFGSSESNAKAADRLKSLLESLKTPQQKLREDIDLLKNSMSGLTGEMKKQAVEGLAILEQKLRDLDPVYSGIKDAVFSFGQATSSAFADAIVNGKNMADALGNAFKSLVAQIIEMAFQLAVVNPILNSIFGLTGGAALPTRQLFKMSAGGGSASVNSPMIVGERGPELFVPSSAGTIMNNMNTKNALGGGGTIIVNQSINVDAGVSQTVRAEMLSLLPRFKADTMAAVADAKRRGGSFSAAFG